jgi:ABC-type Mn2+/Zn2+ transport system permease subunit
VIVAVTPPPPRVSRGFLRDILSDDEGIDISRMQMAVWTLVLTFVFVYSVWSDLAMPTFDPVLLGLLGISNGTYVGFKMPAALK